jgi:phage minor structural protein
MTPILHEDSETSIRNYGWGALKDATSCTVSCEENGAFDLTLIYPMTGLHAEKLLERKLISAAPSLYENRQLFRIYRITRPMDGRIQAYAHHISYDLNNCVVKPFTASSLSEAISKLRGNIVGDCPFSISADYDTSGDFSVSKPMTVRAAMLSSNGDNLADTYDGVWSFDGMSCVLKRKVTTNRGVQIAYGLNLLDVTQEKNIEDIYTHVYPYWMNAEKGKYYDLAPIQASTITGYRKIYPLDLTSYYEKAPSDASMKKTAQEFIAKNEIGKIEVSLTVSYVQLEKCVEYTGSGQSKIILRGDTVEVRYLRLGVSALARVAKTDYNVLLDRYDSIQVGNVKEKLARTTVRERSRVTTTNDRAVDASRVATNYIAEKADGDINFGVGDYSYIINRDGLEFRGIQNQDEIKNWYGYTSFGQWTISVDLSGYSAVLLTFESNKGSTWLASGGGAGATTMIVPVNGKTYSMMYAWNTVHRRDVTVWPDKIVFGAGYERTSKYIMITATGSTYFSLESPGTDGWKQNSSVCIPRQLFGFM